jgi:hypothetical protein
MNKYDSNKVDTRFLKSGRIRMRFKLSELGYETVANAISMTGYRYDHTSLDAICMNYLSAKPTKLALDNPAEGTLRFLVKLFPEEYEMVRCALDEASDFAKSDAESLVMICNLFIHFEESNAL